MITISTSELFPIEGHRVTGSIKSHTAEQSLWHLLVASALNAEAHTNQHLVKAIEKHFQSLLRHAGKFVDVYVHFDVSVTLIPE